MWLDYLLDNILNKYLRVHDFTVNTSTIEFVQVISIKNKIHIAVILARNFYTFVKPKKIYFAAIIICKPVIIVLYIYSLLPSAKYIVAILQLLH